jgi:class 3 adenylate cyclase
LKAHPDLIAGFLKGYCDEASKAVFQNGGMLDKFIGDGVMALFGVLSHEQGDGVEDAANAVRAAFAFRDRFTTLTNTWMRQWRLYAPQAIEIELGCGIHTGEVLVGNVGTDFRDQFTALGPHVNLAARIEGRSKNCKILISQSTESRVNTVFELVPADRINDIKNIPGEFQLYEAISIR